MIRRSTLALAVLAAVSLNAHALQFDQDVTNNAIYGNGGNANGGFTVDTVGSLELGLRTHIRHSIPGDAPLNVFNSNGNGTYSQAAGEPAGFGGAGQNRARWNFDWSVNTNQNGSGTNISTSGLTFTLGMDTDTSAGTSYTVLNLLVPPIGVYDHSFGNNSTGDSGGAEATTAPGFATLASTNNLMQNSWNYDFFDALFSFDPNASGLYSIFLQASNDAGAVVGRTEILVCVGDVACPTDVPEPASLALLGLGLAGLGFSRRRKA